MIKKVFLGSALVLCLLLGVILGNTLVPKDCISDALGSFKTVFGGRIEFENLNEIDSFFYGEDYLNKQMELSRLDEETYHYLYNDGYNKIESFTKKHDNEYIIYSKISQKGAIKGYEYSNKNYTYTFDRDYNLLNKTETTEEEFTKNLSAFIKYNYGLNIMLNSHTVTLVHPNTGNSFEFGYISDYYDRTSIKNTSNQIFEFSSYVGYDSVKKIPGNKISGKLNLKRSYSEVYIFSDLAGTTLIEYSLSEWIKTQETLPSYVVSCLNNI